jgi:hypothetical protein
VSYYDETKHKAHKVAQDFIARGLPLVIVQPGGVYGPGDTSPQGRLIHQFLDGKLPAMMFPETGFNMGQGRRGLRAGRADHDHGRSNQGSREGGRTEAAAADAALDHDQSGRSIGAIDRTGDGTRPQPGRDHQSHRHVTYWAKDDKARNELGYSPRGLEQGFHDTLEVEGRLPRGSR